MKKTLLILFVLGVFTTKTFAHFLWIETSNEGKIGKAHEVKVHFGEYTYGAIEKVGSEAFEKVKNFNLWLSDSEGHKTKLKVTAKDNYYLAHFTPKNKGTYTLILDNNQIDVIDYTEYDFGIFKTHYHSTSKVQVGDSVAETLSDNENGLSIKELPASSNPKEVSLQVIYKNKPLENTEVVIFISDQWSKTLTTDENGTIRFLLPWKNTTYVAETTTKEEVPGIYKGEDYEFIWHCATYCLIN